MPLLFTLQTLFSLWMLVDAAKRGAGCLWFAIILMPFGSLAYFFAVKVHDPEFAALRGPLFVRRASLDELRSRAEHAPTLENRLTLAQALHDRGEFAEAAERFSTLLALAPDEKAALYGLGCSRLQLGDEKGALQALEALRELDFKYRGYAGAAALADAYWLAGRREDSLALLEQLAGRSRLLEHQVGLARFLSASERATEARPLLERALREHEHAPSHLRRVDRPHARAARALLRALR